MLLGENQNQLPRPIYVFSFSSASLAVSLLHNTRAELFQRNPVTLHRGTSGGWSSYCQIIFQHATVLCIIYRCVIALECSRQAKAELFL